MSGQYEDDVDDSNDVVYTGQGGHDGLGTKLQNGNRKVSTGIVSCHYLFVDQTSNDTCAHLMVHISLPLCRSKDFRHSPRYTLLTSSQALKTIISLLSFASSYPSFVRYTLNHIFFFTQILRGPADYCLQKVHPFYEMLPYSLNQVFPSLNLFTPALLLWLFFLDNLLCFEF